MRRFRLTGPIPIFAIPLTCMSLILCWVTGGAENYHAHAFLAAVQRSDIQAARAELAHPHNRSYIIKSLDRIGSPPLYQSAMDACVDYGGLGLIRDLMARGAKPSFRHLVTTIKSAGPLDKDLAALSLYLVEHGVPVRGKPGEGNPLSEAMSRHNFRLARALIEHGADLNADNRLSDNSSYSYYSYRPLEAAAFAPNREVTRLLLDHGANPMLTSTSMDSLNTPIWEEIRERARLAQEDPDLPRQPIIIWQMVKPIVEKRLGHRVED